MHYIAIHSTSLARSNIWDYIIYIHDVPELWWFSYIFWMYVSYALRSCVTCQAVYIDSFRTLFDSIRPWKSVVLCSAYTVHFRLFFTFRFFVYFFSYCSKYLCLKLTVKQTCVMPYKSLREAALIKEKKLIWYLCFDICFPFLLISSILSFLNFFRKSHVSRIKYISFYVLNISIDLPEFVLKITVPSKCSYSYLVYKNVSVSMTLMLHCTLIITMWERVNSI